MKLRILTVCFVASLVTEAAMYTDVEYAVRGTTRLTLDAFVPDSPGPHPVVIIVHGGGFRQGNKQSYVTPLFQPLTEASFAWFTINYRLAPKNHFPDPVDDVESAVRWIRQNAEKYRVDPARVALVGESAGAFLVSYLGATRGSLLGIAGIVAFYAPTDLLGRAEKMGISENVQALLNIGSELTPSARQQLKMASPYYQVQRAMPPFLLIHGTADKQVPYEQSVEMQKVLRSAGVDCELVTVENGNHGMSSWANLNSTWKPNMVQWLRQKLKSAPMRTFRAPTEHPVLTPPKPAHR